jgi:DNA-binding CsgD family transcriptional regulator
VEEPAAAAWFTRVALAVGDRRAARGVVTCVERLAVDSPDVPMIAAAAEHARALLDADVDVLDRVAKEHRRPWARGSAAEDAGVASPAFCAEGARRRFDDALEAYAEAGAVRDVGRIRRRLRRLEEDPRERERPLEGWGSLTDAELRVAKVVAAGRTNIEASGVLHLSRHTVDFHLRHVYRKLRIRSRVDLARIVAAHDLSGVD